MPSFGLVKTHSELKSLPVELYVEKPGEKEVTDSEEDEEEKKKEEEGKSPMSLRLRIWTNVDAPAWSEGFSVIDWCDASLSVRTASLALLCLHTLIASVASSALCLVFCDRALHFILCVSLFAVFEQCIWLCCSPHLVCSVLRSSLCLLVRHMHA